MRMTSVVKLVMARCAQQNSWYFLVGDFVSGTGPKSAAFIS